MEYSKVLAQQFEISEEYAANIIALLDDGNTIPFIARYRKEMHGSMDDQLIRQFSEKLDYLRGLDKRREEIRNLIEAQEKLTDEVAAALEKAQTLSELEDIYRPFRPKRKTRASVAKEKGLEPLAVEIIKQAKGFSPQKYAEEFVSEEKGVASADEAIAGAMDIIAEQVSDSAEIRKRIREIAQNNGVLRSVAADEEKESVYTMYYDFGEAVKREGGLPQGQPRARRGASALCYLPPARQGQKSALLLYSPRRRRGRLQPPDFPVYRARDPL